MNHVLIVDDEPEIRRSLEGILQEEGHAAVSAATAAEALTLLRDVEYDVVLLDIWLPDRDGLEVLSEIREMHAEQAPEVVMISGHGTIEAAVRATKLGAFDFLEKPLGLELRQAAHRARYPPRKPAQGPSFRRAELCRHPGGFHRERTLRLPPRRGPP